MKAMMAPISRAPPSANRQTFVMVATVRESHNSAHFDSAHAELKCRINRWLGTRLVKNSGARWENYTVPANGRVGNFVDLSAELTSTV